MNKTIYNLLIIATLAGLIIVFCLIAGNRYIENLSLGGDIATTSLKFSESLLEENIIDNLVSTEIKSEEIFSTSTLNGIVENVSKRTSNTLVFEDKTREIYQIFSQDIAYIDDDGVWKKYITETSTDKILKADSLGHRLFSFLLLPIVYAADTYYGGNDGGCEHTNSVWSTCRSASASTYDWSATDYSYVRTGYYPPYYIDRSNIIFDTSALPDTGATINSALLYVKANDNGQGTVVAVSYALSTACVKTPSTSYSQFGDTSYGMASSSAWSTGNYNYITLNATGISAIQVATTTKLGIRGYKDFANSTPTSGTNDYLNFYKSNRAGTTDDPYLLLDVTTSGGSSPVIANIINFE